MLNIGESNTKELYECVKCIVDSVEYIFTFWLVVFLAPLRRFIGERKQIQFYSYNAIKVSEKIDRALVGFQQPYIC